MNLIMNPLPLLILLIIMTSYGFNIANPKISSSFSRIHAKKITPSQDFRSMDEYRKAVLDVLKSQATDKTKLGGRELLELIIRKWGVAYDIQLRKNAPFGEGSANIYVNVMWRYFGIVVTIYVTL